MKVTPESKGAIGDGITDDTDAVHAAFATGEAIELPGKYKITSPIILSTYDQVIEGDGFSSQILPSGPINAFTSTGSLVRIIARDFSIVGGPETLDAIDLSSGNAYMTELNNLNIYVGGRAIYAPTEFNTRLIGIQFSSHNSNGIELGGGNTTRLDSCYAHQFAPGKYAYRLYSGAQMVSCNSLDVGDNILLAGTATSKGDAVNHQYRLLCQNCNFEDFKNTAVTLRYTGQAVFEMCSWLPPAVVTSPTYDCSVHIEYTNQLVLFIGGYVSSKGAIRNRKADIYSDGGGSPLCIGATDQWDSNGLLCTIPNLTAATASYAKMGLRVDQVISP